MAEFIAHRLVYALRPKAQVDREWVTLDVSTGEG